MSMILGTLHENFIEVLSVQGFSFYQVLESIFWLLRITFSISEKV